MAMGSNGQNGRSGGGGGALAAAVWLWTLGAGASAACGAWISEVFLPDNPMGPATVEVSWATNQGTLTLAIIDTLRGNGTIKQLIDLPGTSAASGPDLRVVTAGTWSADSPLVQALAQNVGDLQLTTLTGAAATDFTANLARGRTLALFRMTDSGHRPSQLLVNQSWLGVRDALLPYLVDDLSYTYTGGGLVYVDGPLVPVGVGDVIAFPALDHVQSDADPWIGQPDAGYRLWRAGPQVLWVTPGRSNPTAVTLHAPGPTSAAAVVTGLGMIAAGRSRRTKNG
jgi:hypothetical protein